jgi:serine/threonine protein kinase
LEGSRVPDASRFSGEKSKPTLSWADRYKAALGIAEALSYVHSGGARPAIHRDVKSSNILLSDEFEPQVYTILTRLHFISCFISLSLMTD